ncbi:MAG: 2OG-Fe(II) oxygenase [Pseudomonadales bacterium]
MSARNAKSTTPYHSTIAHDLDEFGYAVVPKLLNHSECDEMVGLYVEPKSFRSKIAMGRHNFGSGEYQYFDYPLPAIVQKLRADFYTELAPVANEWSQRLRTNEVYPSRLDAFLAECHAKEQRRPTPLLLKYTSGDYNRLHQDLYGEVAFPLQLAICLSESERDFSGGEFILAEQRPRVQTRVEVVPLKKGDGVVFANRLRPIPSVRGYSRVTLRHGVSQIRTGTRYCLGVIFHDAV